MTFHGLTWDHPRGCNALIAAAKRVNAGRSTPLIEWHIQPLEGFESAPIADLAARYDLLVLDHPHIGEAVAKDCLTPLNTLFSQGQCDEWAAGTIGPAFASYVWQGNSWALPLDVATQVMALRPKHARPQTWEQIDRIATDGGVAQSLAGPHAILTLMSMVAGTGASVGAKRFLEPEQAAIMLQRMHRLYALRPKGSERLNPIGLLDAMASDTAISLIPLVFGYVNYMRPARGQLPVAFADSIRAATGAGGVLGGTGIAITTRATPTDSLLAHLVELMSADTQCRFIPRHDGQPSARAAWTDAQVNDAWGGFYAATRDTAETALLRPRFDGYVAFQTAAAAVVRDALDTREDVQKTLQKIETLWSDAHAPARPS